MGKKSKCESCVYSTRLGDGSTVACYYIVNTGRKRPCPPGKKCTAYENGKSKGMKRDILFIDNIHRGWCEDWHKEEEICD